MRLTVIGLEPDQPVTFTYGEGRSGSATYWIAKDENGTASRYRAYGNQVDVIQKAIDSSEDLEVSDPKVDTKYKVTTVKLPGAPRKPSGGAGAYNKASAYRTYGYAGHKYSTDEYTSKTGIVFEAMTEHVCAGIGTQRKDLLGDVLKCVSEAASKLTAQYWICVQNGLIDDKTPSDTDSGESDRLESLKKIVAEHQREGTLDARVIAKLQKAVLSGSKASESEKIAALKFIADLVQPEQNDM